MIYHCLQSSSKCEWSDLRGFVDSYNEANGTAYKREICLDVENSSGKEPEVLLEATGEAPIVIERKSVVWPQNFGSDHNNEHHLRALIFSRLNSAESPFTDSVYKLVVNENSLKERKQSQVGQFAEDIVRAIKSDLPVAKSRRGIKCKEPIPWCFRPLLPSERDENTPKSGVSVIVKGDWYFGDESGRISEENKEAKAGYSEALDKVVNQAAEKFAGYEHCLRLLLVQFFGSSSNWFMDDDVIELIQSAKLPEPIDQVWVAQEDCEIAWSVFAR